MTPSCLVVGAGMAGLTAAAALKDRGWDVVLLDKGRGVGGRMATRRIGGSSFDHGAQFFTVRDSRFREAVARWESDNVVVPWFTEGGHVRYRAVTGMTGLTKHLEKSLDVRSEMKVQHVEPRREGWSVVTESGERFTASALLLTAPAPQSAALLAACAEQLPPEILFTLRSIDFDPCFALLVTLEGASCVPAPGYLRINKGPIEWIADNSQKGISTGGAALTIHASADFSRRYLGAPKDEVATLMLEAARSWFGVNVAAWQLHLWRYSKPKAEPRPTFLFTSKPALLAIAGDAFAGSRIESAFLSGLSAAEKISSGVL